MGRPSMQVLQNQFGEDDNSKGVSYAAYRVHSPFQSIPYGQEDQSSRPNTPSMTNGSSSRSNCSSVIVCDKCSNSEAHLARKSQSDSSSIRYQPSEADYANASPSIRSRQIKGPRHQNSHLRDAVDASSSSCCSTFEQQRLTPPIDNLTREQYGQSPQGSAAYNSQHNLLSHAVLHEPDQMNVDHDTPKTQMAIDHSDTETGEEDDESSEDCENDDDDWSGENGHDSDLELLVMRACQGDLDLAAQLIPMLYKSIYSDVATNKVGPWRRGITNLSSSDRTVASGQSSNSKAGTNNTPEKPRKRQRRSSDKNEGAQEPDHEEEDDDEDEEGDDGGKGRGDKIGSEDIEVVRRLACQFHKHNPSKYSSKEVGYRTCGGPGFKNIQRLKEHLKRKHYPVQCDRCYIIFSGTDRAAGVLLLEEHRQLDTPCERGDSSMKEGISDAQWAMMDKNKTGKQKQSSCKIVKWQEIWAILFPKAECPAHPWYDEQTTSHQFGSNPHGNSHFTKTFKEILQIKVKERYIRFAEGSDQEMMNRIVTLAETTFRVHSGLSGVQSSTTSTSTDSRQQLSYDGSYIHVPLPGTVAARHSSSASRSSQSQAFSADLHIPRSHRGQDSRPPNVSMAQVVPSYATNPLVRSLSAQNSSSAAYGMDTSNNLNSFGGNQLQEQNFAPPATSWDMDFQGTENTFGHGHTSSSLDVPRFGTVPIDLLSQTFVDPSEDGQRNFQDLGCAWDQLPDSHQMHYDGRQGR